MTQTPVPAPPSRSERKRQTILSAGQALFLSNGYQGTSMDQVAASAAVSKQTVYKHFGEKRELLFAIVTDALDTSVTAFRQRVGELVETTDVDAHLIALATEYLRTVLEDAIVQLRRLVISEAGRLPELAQLYYRHAPARTLDAFADAFGRLHRKGLLQVPEPRLAAEHFAFLIVGRPIDQALFEGAPRVRATVDVDSYARAGVRVFLAAYRPREVAR
ncbi:TetR/AcrR family transcriptional regulator [Mycobacterium sp.]|jgi:TetR/AcrR family transcriptional repressor of mexJK operon|uniref:TetR/AcrR family transcriptional regulator n=1 Tax=Mycobacterium sp. TaxID=1785 RepID=UPI002D22E9BE|nr:TetR/AcrR family transcriptional regulator [Mycobacterium sp.]HZA11495.1 TetR/AcrR family transcriptional regulator [Mycobacterium sp.]